MTWFHEVRAFMLGMNDLAEELGSDSRQAIGDRAAPATNDLELRVGLVFEEACEFVEACGFRVSLAWSPVAERHSWGLERVRKPDLVAAIDALCDMLYVIIGTFVAWGLNPQPFWDEVHRSNMAKLGPGATFREDGKMLKPEGWKPPDLRLVLEDEIAQAKRKETL